MTNEERARELREHLLTEMSMDRHVFELDKDIEKVLTQVQAEARLDEAKKWAHNWYGGYDSLGLTGTALKTHRETCRDCQRIAALEHQVSVTGAANHE